MLLRTHSHTVASTCQGACAAMVDLVVCGVFNFETAAAQAHVYSITRLSYPRFVLVQQVHVTPANKSQRTLAARRVPLIVAAIKWVRVL